MRRDKRASWRWKGRQRKETGLNTRHTPRVPPSARTEYPRPPARSWIRRWYPIELQRRAVRGRLALTHPCACGRRRRRHRRRRALRRRSLCARKRKLGRLGARRLADARLSISGLPWRAELAADACRQSPAVPEVRRRRRTVPKRPKCLRKPNGPCVLARAAEARGAKRTRSGRRAARECCAVHRAEARRRERRSPIVSDAAARTAPMPIAAKLQPQLCLGAFRPAALTPRA